MTFTDNLQAGLEDALLYRFQFSNFCGLLICKRLIFYSPSYKNIFRFDSRVPSKAYMYNQAQQRSNRNPSPSKGGHFVSDVKAAVKGALVLLPILGIPWICGMLAGTSYALLMIFVIMNSTQGLAILVVYCILNGEVSCLLLLCIMLFDVTMGSKLPIMWAIPEFSIIR